MTPSVLARISTEHKELHIHAVWRHHHGFSQERSGLACVRPHAEDAATYTLSAVTFRMSMISHFPEMSGVTLIIVFYLTRNPAGSTKGVIPPPEIHFMLTDFGFRELLKASSRSDDRSDPDHSEEHLGDGNLRTVERTTHLRNAPLHMKHPICEY
ncbi:hypothetical protein EYF80_038804 [Liparis tanakae]|uniref:Uncharacterized protein n=1 Tax=Liparis tanakae TaxID=230148 RepID=A0A4Z2GEA1_9TELE|nr:hypothetical protein EYF80_038804 [Liparis tanakae]